MQFLALLPILLYLLVVWHTTGNTPQGDGIIQALFTVIYFDDAKNFTEQLQNTWWTYFQHRAALSKLVTLGLHAAKGHVDIHGISLVGNLMLCHLAWRVAANAKCHGLPPYTLPVATLMIASFYAWTVTTWPECTLFYFGTLWLAFLCFELLDRERPAVLAAIACSWLAAFTMANGLLTIVVGSLIVLWHQYNDGRYSRMQCALWFGGALACLGVHLATMNVFSTDLYGAKSVQDSFINLSGRLADFFESMGAAPFPTGEYRYGKIALGAAVLAATAALATSRQSLAAPAITGLLLFCSGTLFLTSLFRYSAGGNDGYQVFTATNMAALLLIGAAQCRGPRTRIIAMLLITTAVLFNINALLHNFNRMQLKQAKLTTQLQTLLVTGNPGSALWSDVILQESLVNGIYRPLRAHNSLPIPAAVQALELCPEGPITTAGTLLTETAPSALGLRLRLLVPALPVGEPIVLLCGEQSAFRLQTDNRHGTPGTQAVALQLLLDKTQFPAGNYRVRVMQGGQQIELPQPLVIAEPVPLQSAEKDCQVMRDTVPFKAGRPLVDHYCRGTTSQ